MTATLPTLTPEITLIAAAVAIYLGGTFCAARRAWRWIAGGAVLLAAAALCGQHPQAATHGVLNIDMLACQGRWFALAVGGLLLLLGDGPPESVGSTLLATAGLMLVASAADLVLLFVALELISIPTYVLLYLGRRDAASQESAAKYFFLSVLASAILLYGLSFYYGLGGTTALGEARAAICGGKPAARAFASLVPAAMTLVFAGLCFKITAVPLHFYAPDVYQGTTYPNAALLSTLPKAAGFVALARLLVMVAPAPHVWQIVLVVAVMTMTLGNTMALWQSDLRRLLAYSAIAHGGYMLLAFAAAMVQGGASSRWDGLAAVWFYMVTYAAATIGAFAVAQYLGRPDRRLDAVEELAGLGRARPGAAALLAVFMFSLAGVPPLAGFWGKLLVFGAAIDVETPRLVAVRWWFVAAPIVGVLNAAVAAAYYLRIVAVMYFRTPLATPRAEGGRGAWWAAVACAAAVVGVGLYPGPLMRATQESRAATPVCPMPRSGGDHAGSYPTDSLLFRLSRRAPVDVDRIIEEGSDNRLSPQCELVAQVREIPPRK